MSDRRGRASCAGAGRIICRECDGGEDAYRKLFPPELDIPHCVDCKGTGFVYVSI